ncbi:MAG: AAA family ATPase, partial [Mogibacterium sp.]|nr:AAA family ATPase [Mogibacterium sp.]
MLYNAYSNEAAVKAANYNEVIHDDLFFEGLTATDPEALRELWGDRRWAVHRNKVPFNPLSGLNAKSNDPNKCVLFSDASTALNEYDGVEYLLGNGLCGIDLDHCIDPETGRINEEAYQIVDMLDSYAEISPSGTGIHILIRGDMPFTGRQGSRDADLQIEMYSEYRFLTITGNAVNDKSIAERTEEIKALADQYFPATELNKEHAAASTPIDPDNDQKMILSALDAIDPTDCNYNQWLRIGVATLEAGFEPDIWDEWSSRDPDRYKPGECAKKWSTFKDMGQNSSGIGIIIERAKENGWEPGDAFDEDDKEEYFRKKGLQELRNMNLPPVSDISAESDAAAPVDAYETVNSTAVDAASLRDSTLSAADLMDMDIRKPSYIVEDLIPVGGTILAGPPKAGKSLMAMQIATNVSAGAEFLDHKTEKIPVLYLALEDSFARIKDRLIKQGYAKRTDNPPDFRINAPKFDDGLIEMIKEYIDTHGKSLIIIDTLQRVRPDDVRGVSEYKQDYPLLTDLSALARERESAILLIHHTRKTEDPNNPFNMINGSVAIQGATDAMMVITRDKQQFQQKRATLHVTGRDIGLNEVEMALLEPNLSWVNAEIEDEKSRRLLFDSDPIITTLRTIMEEFEEDPDIEDKIFTTTAQGLLDEVITRTGECTDLGPKECTRIVCGYSDLLAEDGILVSKPVKTERVNGVS